MIYEGEITMQNNTQPNTAPQPSGGYAMPMKWHKFLIYFSLWAGAVLNVGTAIGYLTGSIYTDPETVYHTYAGLKTVDLLMSIVILAFAVLLIVTRFALAGFKVNAPKLLLIVYAVYAAVLLLYPLILVGVTGLSYTDLWEPVQLISNTVMIFANKVYYDKRASLFVN